MLGSKKFVKFNRVSDFEYQLYYPSTLSSKKPVPICKVKVTGLTDAIKKYKDQMVELPTVKTIIQLSDSGLLQFRSKPTAEFSLKVEETKEEPAKDSGFFGGLFGGGKAEEGEKETKEGEKETKEGEETSSESTDGDKTKTPTKVCFNLMTFNAHRKKLPSLLNPKRLLSLTPTETKSSLRQLSCLIPSNGSLFLLFLKSPKKK